MTDILLVEDHQELNELISVFLEREGYCVQGVSSGEEALLWLKDHRVKLIVLDVSLPEMDGFAVCARIREYSSTPILFLSARVDKEDKMNGFVQGADDYVEKPVDMDILCAKIKALLLRSYSLKQENPVICSGGLTIDQGAKQVYLDHQEITLTVKEYALLLLFVYNPDKTLHKDYLFNQILVIASDSEYQTLTVHIKRLRDKIEEDPKNPRRIRTVWGIGYRYEEI